MKIFYIVPLLFLVACSTPKPPLAMRPQEPRQLVNDDAVRYPEAVGGYYVGRYADPNKDLLHEQHVVYRVEANSHWNFHPGPRSLGAAEFTTIAHDTAFAPLPVNDAILAEINSQKATTAAVITQARQLSSALEQFQIALNQTKTNLQETAAMRAAMSKLEKRLESLEAGQQQLLSPPSVSTNAQANPLPPPDP